MSRLKKSSLAALALSLFSLSSVFAQGNPTKLPANFEEEPKNLQAIDLKLVELEKQKEELEARKYEADEAAMDHEFQGTWMNYQEDIKKNGTFESRIAKIQAEIDALHKERNKLTK